MGLLIPFPGGKVIKIRKKMIPFFNFFNQSYFKSISATMLRKEENNKSFSLKRTHHLIPWMYCLLFKIKLWRNPFQQCLKMNVTRLF
jgi:hypothetical protein